MMSLRRVFPGGIGEHFGRCCARRRLTKIAGRGASVGKANHHKSTAADVAGDWIRDSERKSGGYRGIDCIATAGKNVDYKSMCPGHDYDIYQRVHASCAFPRSGASIGLQFRTYLVARTGVRASRAELAIPERPAKPL